MGVWVGVGVGLWLALPRQEPNNVSKATVLGTVLFKPLYFPEAADSVFPTCHIVWNAMVPVAH